MKNLRIKLFTVLSLLLQIQVSANSNIPPDLTSVFKVPQYPEQACLVRMEEIPPTEPQEGEESVPTKHKPIGFYVFTANIPLPSPLPDNFNPQNYIPNTILYTDLEKPMEDGKRVLYFGKWSYLKKTFTIEPDPENDEDKEDELINKEVIVGLKVEILRKRTFSFYPDGTPKDEFINGPNFTFSLNKNGALSLKDKDDLFVVPDTCRRTR